MLHFEAYFEYDCVNVTSLLLANYLKPYTPLFCLSTIPPTAYGSYLISVNLHILQENYKLSNGVTIRLSVVLRTPACQMINSSLQVPLILVESPFSGNFLQPRRSAHCVIVALGRLTIDHHRLPPSRLFYRPDINAAHPLVERLGPPLRIPRGQD